MKTIVVSNHKGGVGKTAISVHLAMYLEEKGKTVLVIDLDGQGNASKTLGRYRSGVHAASLFEPEPPRVAQAGAITLVEASHRLSDIEQAPKQAVLSALRRVLPTLRGQFDYCVIDTPPGAGLRISAAMLAAQFVLSPVEMDDYSIDGTTQLLQTVVGIQQRFNTELAFLGMLPNRLNAASIAQRAVLQSMLARYPQFMVPAKIGNRSSIPEALRAGVPVWRLQKTAAREAGHEMLNAFGIISQRIGL
jgi:chromosome partitioning protein